MMRPIQKFFRVTDETTGKTHRTGGYSAADAALKLAVEAGRISERCIPPDYIVRETLKMCDAAQRQVERARKGYKYGGNQTLHAAWSYDQAFGLNAKHLKEAQRAAGRDAKKEKTGFQLRKQEDHRENSATERWARLAEKAQKNQRFYTAQMKAPSGNGRFSQNSSVMSMTKLTKRQQVVNINGRLYTLSDDDK